MCQNEEKKQIIELVEQMPDQYISTALEYIKDLLALRELDEEASNHLTDIMEEDDNLLKRLAE